MKKHKEQNAYDLSHDEYNLSSRDNRTSTISKYSNTNDNMEKDKVNMFEFKVILLGNIAVGKTAIINRFVDNTFTDQYKCTLQTAFRNNSINIDGRNIVNMKIWDTCGEEKYKALTRQYYINTHGIILIFDLTNSDSFLSLETWLADIKKHGPKDYDIIVIGNKSDLEVQRTVTNEEIQIFSERENITYLEVSAKNGTNVLLLFERISEKMIKRNKELSTTNKSMSYNEGDSKKSSKAEMQIQQMLNKKKEESSRCC